MKLLDALLVAGAVALTAMAVKADRRNRAIDQMLDEDEYPEMPVDIYVMGITTELADGSLSLIEVESPFQWLGSVWDDLTDGD